MRSAVHWNPEGLQGALLDDQLASEYQCAGSISISVTDNGPGMSKEDQKLLFGEGVQFNANKLQSGQGSGLGLHFAKGVIELHGGQMSAYSDGVGCGATFTTELPVIDLKRKVSRLSNSADQEEINNEKSFLRMESNNTVGDDNENVHDLMAAEITFHNLLVVDDSKPTRRMTSRLLTGEGYKCTEVEDGRQCVDLMKSMLSDTTLPEAYRIDVIFMDYEMPVLNGPDATAELRALGIRVPVIGITGNALPEDRAHFMNAGADCVLTKPLDIRKLALALNEFRARRHFSGKLPALEINKTSVITTAVADTGDSLV